MKQIWTATILTACLLVVGCSKSTKSSLPEATLDDLNRALRAWPMVKPTPPAQVSDLTNFPSLRTKRLPTPPPGKKLVIDSLNKQVVFVDE